MALGILFFMTMLRAPMCAGRLGPGPGEEGVRIAVEAADSQDPWGRLGVVGLDIGRPKVEPEEAQSTPRDTKDTRSARQVVRGRTGRGGGPLRFPAGCPAHIVDRSADVVLIHADVI